MVTGQLVRLTSQILGVDIGKPKPEAVSVPGGEVVEVVSEYSPTDERFATVTWKNRTLAVFVQDLRAHGREV